MIFPMDGRQRAALAVAARRGRLEMTQQQLADAAGVDIKTIGNLESRGRWPIARSRARIERALGWPEGEMARIAAADEEKTAPVPPELEAHPELVADIRRRRPDPADQAAVMDAIASMMRGDPPPPTEPDEAARWRDARRAG